MGTDVSSTMTYGMSHVRMCGCIKVDNDDAGVNVEMHESCGAGDRHGRRVLGMWESVEMGNPDVSSVRCNTLWMFVGLHWWSPYITPPSGAQCPNAYDPYHVLHFKVESPSV